MGFTLRIKMITSMPLNWFILLVFLSFFFFSSCKKVDTEQPSSNMVATIGGQKIIFSGSTAFYPNQTWGIKSINGYLSIEGYSGLNVYNVNQYQLNIGIINLNPNFIGSYPFGGSTSQGVATYEFAPPSNIWPTNNWTMVYNTDSTYTGKFNITSYDAALQTISGTFNFMAYTRPILFAGKSDSVLITNGSFFLDLNQVYR